jgi:hypothetical protein
MAFRDFTNVASGGRRRVGNINDMTIGSCYNGTAADKIVDHIGPDPFEQDNSSQ